MAKLLKKMKIETMITYTKVGARASPSPAPSRYMSRAIQGMIPAMQP